MVLNFSDDLSIQNAIWREIKLLIFYHLLPVRTTANLSRGVGAEEAQMIRLLGERGEKKCVGISGTLRSILTRNVEA